MPALQQALRNAASVSRAVTLMTPCLSAAPALTSSSHHGVSVPGTWCIYSILWVFPRPRSALDAGRCDCTLPSACFSWAQLK